MSNRVRQASNPQFPMEVSIEMAVLDALGIPWTRSQLEALDIDANIAVTAGAGSGKTQVLAARYLLAAERLIGSKDYVGPEGILVLTFTEKAAAEMRERIGKAISAYIDGKAFAGLPEGVRERWLRFSEDLPCGEISTIHSFCARVLRRYPIESKVDPEFAVIEGDDYKQLLENAVMSVMTSLSVDMDPALETLLKTWNASYLADMLATIVVNRDELSDWIRRYKNSTAEELEQHQRGVIDGIVKEALKRLCAPENSELVADITSYPAVSDPSGDKLEEKRRLLAEFWSRCTASLDRGAIDYDAVAGLLGLLCNSSGGPRSFGRIGKASVWGPEGKEYIASRFQLLAEAVVAELPDIGYSFGKTDLSSIQILKALAEVGDSAIQRFRAMKDQARVLDFKDLEIRTRDLLRAHPQVRAELARHYRYVMVDEFQDTSDIQWEIIRALCTDMDCGSFSRDKLFLVGDEKQAIYSFRGGDVATFAKARRELAGKTAPKEAYRKVVFGENFRSCQQLVDSFNYLFSRVLDSGDVEDFEAEFQEMVKANKSLTSDGSAEVHLIGVPDGMDASLAALVEAETVAKLAGEMVENSAIKEFAGNKLPRVAILLRRMSVARIYEDALRRHGLGFSTVKGQGFYQQQEVLDVFNLLAFLSDTRRDIELFGVLRSPIFALTDEEVAKILTNGEGTVWERLRQSTMPGAVRCREALERWLLLRDRCSVASLIRYILADSSFYCPLAYGPRGRQRLANIEKVVSLARSADSKGHGLAAFVASLERQIAGEEPEGEADITVDSPIVLMTIHQAKGLQFPAVIVPDLAGRFNLGTDSPIYMGEVNGQTEVGIKAPDPDRQGELQPTAFRELIKDLSRPRQLAEEKRLLYVAATRAQLMLAMVGQRPTLPLRHADYYMLNNWSEWLVKALDLESAYIGADAPAFVLHPDRPVRSSRAQVGPLTVFFHEVDLAGSPDSAQQQIEASSETAAVQEADSHQRRSTLLIKKLEALDKLGELAAARLTPAATRLRFRCRRVITLSATAVMDFERCPKLFLYRHGLRIPEQLLAPVLSPSYNPGVTDSSTAFGAKLGDLFHRLVALEVYDADDPRIVSIVRSLLSPTDRGLLWEYVATIKEHLDTLVSLGYTDRLRRLPPSFRRRELGLDLVIESNSDYEVRFIGFIDMLVYSGDTSWRILDFKTNALHGRPVDVFTKDNLYDLQMELYMATAGLALERAQRPDTIEKAEIIYTSAKDKYEVEPNPGALDRLLEIADKVYRGEFEEQESDMCRQCLYQSLCQD